MFHSNLDRFKSSPSISAVTKTAGLTGDVTKGTGVDLQGFDSATLITNLGVIAHADTTGAIVIEHSDTDVDGDYAAIAAADQLGDALTGLVIANSSTIKKTGYIGNKRYVRAKLTVTTGAATGSFPLACSFHLANARVNPPA